MQREEREPRIGGDESADVPDPAEFPDRRPRDRDPWQRGRHVGEVARVGAEVIGGWAAGDRAAARRREPAPSGIQLGLVAELERLDPAPPDAGQERARLGSGQDSAVRLQVDAQDQAWPQGGCDPPDRLQPLRPKAPASRRRARNQRPKRSPATNRRPNRSRMRRRRRKSPRQTQSRRSRLEKNRIPRPKVQRTSRRSRSGTPAATSGTPGTRCPSR